MQHLEPASPQAGVDIDAQQSGAPQEAFQGSHPQHTEQFQLSHSSHGQQSRDGRHPQRQDQLQDASRSVLLTTHDAMLAPDHPASQLSPVPYLAAKQGLPPPEAQSQSEMLNEPHPKLNQYSFSQHTAAVLYDTPLLSETQSNSLSSPSQNRLQLGSHRTPSLAAAEEQRGFSAVAADNAGEASDAELSPMQRALRSLSSKGFQTSRSPSGKDSGEAHTFRDGSFASLSKLSLGPQHGQHSNETPSESKVGNGQGLGVEEVQGPLSQRVGAVREMASRLNLRSNSSKHMS